MSSYVTTTNGQHLQRPTRLYESDQSQCQSLHHCQYSDELQKGASTSAPESGGGGRNCGVGRQEPQFKRQSRQSAGAGAKSLDVAVDSGTDSGRSGKNKNNVGVSTKLLHGGDGGGGDGTNDVHLNKQLCLLGAIIPNLQTVNEESIVDGAIELVLELEHQKMELFNDLKKFHASSVDQDVTQHDELSRMKMRA